MTPDRQTREDVTGRSDIDDWVAPNQQQVRASPSNDPPSVSEPERVGGPSQHKNNVAEADVPILWINPPDPCFAVSATANCATDGTTHVLLDPVEPRERSRTLKPRHACRGERHLNTHSPIAVLM
jgi:hypothetical protein